MCYLNCIYVFKFCLCVIVVVVIKDFVVFACKGGVWFSVQTGFCVSMWLKIVFRVFFFCYSLLFVFICYFKPGSGHLVMVEKGKDLVFVMVVNVGCLITEGMWMW